MTEKAQHCKTILFPHRHKVMPISSTQPLKNGEIAVNGFVFKDVTHIKLTGTGREMEFVEFLRNGETLAHVDVRTIRGDIFVHSLADKKVIETMLVPVCKHLKKVIKP